MTRFTPFDFGVSWVMSLFHQDWTLDDDSAAHAVARQLEGSVDEEALAVRRDAQVLLQPSLVHVGGAVGRRRGVHTGMVLPGRRCRVDADGRRPV